MSSTWNKITGTQLGKFILGFTGVTLKNNSENLAVRNNSDTAYTDVIANRIVLRDVTSTVLASSATESYILTFPNNTGHPGQRLTTDGSGVTRWSAADTVVQCGKTESAAIIPDATQGTVFVYEATGNFTLDTINAAEPGCTYRVIIKQDSVGSRILSSSMSYAGGNRTLSTAPGAVDIITVFYSGTHYYATLINDYK